MPTQVQVVLASVPWTDTNSLLMAPGLLKSSLTANNIASIAIDLNQEVRQRVLSSPYKDQLIHFMLTSEVKAESTQAIHDLFSWMADRLLDYKSEWIALSLLTYLSQHSCRWLCFLIKQRNPEVKIIIGGAGCFSSLQGIDTFSSQLTRTGLIDYFISGDGEQSLVELINGNDGYSGVNSMAWKEIENLNQVPFPDYSDYNFDLYKINSVGILGSRGCVRECTFCDIHEHWSKFRWRDADSIFAEIIHQYTKHRTRIFKFSDSLINGNQKEYRKLIKLLADFNRTRIDDEKIQWTSFFIFRPAGQMSEEDWQLTKESGAILLMVGVESFVDHIREHLKKKFTNVDLEYNLQLAQKYQVPVSLLVIVGYVTETAEDHQAQLEWVRQNKCYANNPVVSIHIGSTLGILPGTWLHKHYKELGIVLNSDEVYQDWTREDISSTPEIRMQRHRELNQELTENGFCSVYSQDNHMLIENYVKTYAGQNNN